MKILITGSRGFIGKNINYFFKKKKKYNTIAIDKKNLDLTKTSLVKDFLKKNKNINCIINCATAIQENKDYASNVVEINMKMFFNLINFKDKKTKFINLGSGSEYSRIFWKKKMKENFFGKNIPEDGHSFSKYLQSKYIQDVNIDNLYHLRLFGIFGKHEDYKYKFISNTVAKALMGMPIHIHQNCIYDYLDIDDFCKIVEFFLLNNPRERIFNITPNKSIKLNEIASFIISHLESKSKLKIINKGFGKEYTGDNTKLIESFSKIKFTPFKKSVIKLIDYLKIRKQYIDKKKLKEDDFLKYAGKINPINNKN